MSPLLTDGPLDTTKRAMLTALAGAGIDVAVTFVDDPINQGSTPVAGGTSLVVAAADEIWNARELGMACPSRDLFITWRSISLIRPCKVPGGPLFNFPLSYRIPAAPPPAGRHLKLV